MRLGQRYIRTQCFSFIVETKQSKDTVLCYAMLCYAML